MDRTPGKLRTTFIGGLVFLLPLILILWLLSKAFEVAQRLAQPVVRAIGVPSVGGVAFGAIIAVIGLVVITFLAGLIAHTRLGKATYSTLENSILGVFPQWRMARGAIESFAQDGMSNVEVVLVPTDAGWCIGFVLEKTENDWWTVFIPGAPQWTSGQLSYAHAKQVHHTDLTFAQALLILRRLGTGSDKIRDLLQSLDDKRAL
jgi:uncharacterized membrane protein